MAAESNTYPSRTQSGDAREAFPGEIQNFLDTVMENVPVSIFVQSPDTRVIFANRAGEELFGIPRSELIGKLHAQLYPPETAAGVTLADRLLIETREPQVHREILFQLPARGVRTVNIQRRAIASPDGELLYLVSVFEDVTERKCAERRIAHMAHHDPLTDLPNRAAFREHIDAVLNNCAAQRKRFAVLCLDLDHFKEVNDVFGHSVGDALLCRVTDAMRKAAGGAFLARLGGDEFVAVISDDVTHERAAETAERLISIVSSGFVIDGHMLRVGLSVGMAIFPDDGTEAMSLVAHADAALYRAKADGRGVLRLFESDMDRTLRDRHTLTEDLRSAVQNGEIVLLYQPQARMDGQIVGFEALARWLHPRNGLVLPEVFIPLAEESGVILDLGEMVLREACREAASWIDPLNIAVNLSAVQFRHGDLVNLVHSILLETRLPAARLELEITESVLIEDMPRVLSILRRLKALGVRISMDDFGTGYSSLSNLQAFAFDKIKIDRSFISNLGKNPQAAVITRAVIGLARGLDLPVVAEGVETTDQLDFLIGESCNEIQGFKIGKPLPIEEYAELIGKDGVARRGAVSRSF